MKIVFSVLMLLFTSSVMSSDIDIAKIKPGELIVTEWNELPILVYKRTHKEIESLKATDKIPNILSDKRVFYGFARTYSNELATQLLKMSLRLDGRKVRSLRDDVLVVLGISSTYGCAIDTNNKSIPFFDPCSGSRYGLDGRITKASKREIHNLLIPPHSYQNDTLVIRDTASDSKVIDFTPDIMKLNVSDGKKLLEAIQWRKYAYIEQLLARPGVLHYQTETGSNALHLAASRANPEIITSLIKAGFNVNSVNANGITPLHMSLLSNKDSNAVTLLKNGAQYDDFCIEGTCAKPAHIFLSDFYVYINKKQAKKHVMDLISQSQRVQ